MKISSASGRKQTKMDKMLACRKTTTYNALNGDRFDCKIATHTRNETWKMSIKYNKIKHMHTCTQCNAHTD